MRKKDIEDNRDEDLLTVCNDMIVENENKWKKMKLDNETLERLREETEKEEEQAELSWAKLRQR